MRVDGVWMSVEGVWMSVDGVRVNMNEGWASVLNTALELDVVCDMPCGTASGGWVVLQATWLRENRAGVGVYDGVVKRSMRM